MTDHDFNHIIQPYCLVNFCMVAAVDVGSQHAQGRGHWTGHYEDRHRRRQTSGTDEDSDVHFIFSIDAV